MVSRPIHYILLQHIILWSIKNGKTIEHLVLLELPLLFEKQYRSAALNEDNLFLSLLVFAYTLYVLSFYLKEF